MVVAGRQVGVDLGDIAGNLQSGIQLQGAARGIEACGLRATSIICGSALSTAAWRLIGPISWAL
jgi:hypothetical protein